MEEWRDVIGYEGFYQVSNLGRVKSLPRVIGRSDGRSRSLVERIITLSKNPDGYLHVPVSRNAKKEMKKAHRLVCEAFLPNPENKPHVNHINSVRDDNRLENLEWCTSKENSIHAFKLGNRVPLRGSKQWASKLTEEKVLEIRKLLSSGTKRKLLPGMFGVTKSTISDIVHNRIWKHLA